VGFVKTEITQRPAPRSTAALGVEQPAIGDWFHVTGNEYSSEEKKNVKVERLRCVTHVGSNYVELTGVGGAYCRVHYDEFDARCRPEPDAKKVIEGEIDRWRGEAGRLMGQVRELTSKLAVAPRGELPERSETAALVLHSGAQSMGDYKEALIKARDVDLPALFKEIKKANEQMGLWMSAQLIPMEAQAEGLKGSIAAIKSRVHNVELYAGLVEEVVEIRGGEPAAIDERVRLMQRRHYMDEECLAHYEVGGMEFKDIDAFDQWIARDDNFRRILPFPRCAVALRVRRRELDREWVDLSSFIRMTELRALDKTTFLYLRNGDRLHALRTEIDFGAKLFPDLDNYALASGGVLWAEGARSGANWIKGVITDAAHRGLVEDRRAAKVELKKAKRERKGCRGPKTKIDELNQLLHDAEWRVRDYDSALGSYERFTPDSVYFDDIAEYVSERMAEHNRLVLVLQGLFDRSPVFHPHPVRQLWTREGYEASVELVYDDARALTPGDAPDFEAYRARLNADLKIGSVTVGQHRAWVAHETKKENDRRSRSWRYSRQDRELTHFTPEGDPGPGELAAVRSISRDKSLCTFEWQRKRLRSKWRYEFGSREIAARFSCPSSELLNVSAYQPGDFKVFFNDPRTRADYLQWAPLLLEAEEYHAGNREIRKEEAAENLTSEDE
jgi:hypothetical protein